MGYRIREYRVKKNMTQTELSELSGVSRATISMIENDDLHNVKSFTLDRIAAALGVEMRDLFLPSPSSQLDDAP